MESKNNQNEKKNICMIEKKINNSMEFIFFKLNFLEMSKNAQKKPEIIQRKIPMMHNTEN